MDFGLPRTVTLATQNLTSVDFEGLPDLTAGMDEPELTISTVSDRELESKTLSLRFLDFRRNWMTHRPF